MGAAAPSPPPPSIGELKWTKEDFKEAKGGQLPLGKTPDEWSYGDLTEGFKKAALVLDETFLTPDTSHYRLSRRAARWRTGRTARFTSTPGTQSTAQTVRAIARWLNIDPSKVILTSEYTGSLSAARAPRGYRWSSPPRFSQRRRTGR